jgi:hypothetical protein
MDRRKIIAFASGAASFLGIALAVVSTVWGHGIFAITLFFGAFALPLYALCVAHTNDFVPAADFVATSGELLLVFGIGAAIGPLMAPLAKAIVGIGGLFAFTALVHGALVSFVVFRMTTRAHSHQPERTDFAVIPQTAPTVFKLDRRCASESAKTRPTGE